MKLFLPKVSLTSQSDCDSTTVKKEVPLSFRLKLNWDSLSIDLGFQGSNPIKNPRGTFFYLSLATKNCSLKKGPKQCNFGSFSKRMKTWFVIGKLFRKIDLIPKKSNHTLTVSEIAFLFACDLMIQLDFAHLRVSVIIEMYFW